MPSRAHGRAPTHSSQQTGSASPRVELVWTWSTWQRHENAFIICLKMHRNCERLHLCACWCHFWSSGGAVETFSRHFSSSADHPGRGFFCFLPRLPDNSVSTSGILQNIFEHFKFMIVDGIIQKLAYLAPCLLCGRGIILDPCPYCDIIKGWLPQ